MRKLIFQVIPLSDLDGEAEMDRTSFMNGDDEENESDLSCHPPRRSSLSQQSIIKMVIPPPPRLEFILPEGVPPPPVSTER